MLYGQCHTNSHPFIICRSFSCFRIMVGIVTPVLILLSWVKKLKDLWIFSLLGLLVYVVGVIGVGMVEGLSDWRPPVDE